MELWMSFLWLVCSAKFRLNIGKEKHYCYTKNWKIKKQTLNFKFKRLTKEQMISQVNLNKAYQIT